METEKPEKTNIELDVPTRERIKTFGNMGDKYSIVLNKLMDACEPAKEFRDIETEPPHDRSGHIPRVRITNIEETQ